MANSSPEPDAATNKRQKKMLLQVDITLPFERNSSFSLGHDERGVASFKFSTRNSKGSPERVTITEFGERGFKLSDFEIVCELGRGVGGNVQKAFHRPSRTHFALKEVNISSSSPRDQLRKELNMHKQCGKMRNIVDLYDVFYEEGRVYLVLELMSWGSLEELLKAQNQKSTKMSESLLAHIMREILMALNFLHNEHEVVHRDVKPGNILINDTGEIKLSDFGTSRHASDESSAPSSAAERPPSSEPLEPPDTASFGGTNFVGTTGYMSPQQLNDESHTYKADIWSLGIVALECATGHHPYLGPDGLQQVSGILELVQRVLSEDPPTAVGLGMTEGFESFIDVCLKRDETERYTAAQLLVHPFVVNNTDDGSKARFATWLTEFNRGHDQEV